MIKAKRTIQDISNVATIKEGMIQIFILTASGLSIGMIFGTLFGAG